MSADDAAPQLLLQQRGEQRAFLTQSAHSTGFGSRATTAAAASGSRQITRPTTGVTATAGSLSVDGMERASAASWTTWRAATADESRARMALARRERLGESETLARMARASAELRAYSRGRFQEELGRERASHVTERTTERHQGPHRLTSTRSSLSPYLTLLPPVTLAIDPEEAFAELSSCARCRAGDAAANERSAGKVRAQLMSQVRLCQPRQTVRFRHDRTAQELCQEGGLPSREVCEPFPWRPDYQYSPFPEPKVTAWAETEWARRQERLRLADELDSAGARELNNQKDLAVLHSPPMSPPPVLLIELTPALEAAAATPLTDRTPEEPTTTMAALDVEKQVKTGSGRPRSGRGKQPKRSPQQQLQLQLQQQQQQLLQQQLQLERLAAARRRNFSVSTIGEDELGQSREEQQRLVDICQRLRDRQAAREAEAAAIRAAEEAARLALETPPPPPPPPQEPLPPPTPPPLQASQKQKKTTKTAAKSKKSPRPASGGKKQQPRSSSASSSGSGGSRKAKKPEQPPAQPQKLQAEKPSPRSKSPKAGVAAKKKGAAAAGSKNRKAPPGNKKKTQKASAPTPPPPPQPEPPLPPPQPSEPRQPDALDLLAEQIETASVFHRTKPPGELPDLPCPSSEAKSRQRLTKLWWQRQDLAAAPPSVIA